MNLDDPHWKEAFLRPSKSHGTLIQIAQSSAPDDVVKDRLRPGNLRRAAAFSAAPIQGQVTEEPGIDGVRPSATRGR